MKIVVLGCGASNGVPMIGCGCKVCASGELRNRRLRQSLFIEAGNTKIVIDCGPDFRAQMLNNNIDILDGVLVTHAHFDHIGGMDDLKAIAIARRSPIPVYADGESYERLEVIFGYLFGRVTYVGGEMMPAIEKRIIEAYQGYVIGDIAFSSFCQNHGHAKSLGYKFDRFAYSTDFKSLADQDIDYIRNIDTWFVDCIGYRDYVGHANLDDALRLIKEIRPNRAVLIHMSHEVDYLELSARLPSNVVVAYDNMKFSV